MAKAILIVFGPPGSGKDTQINLLLQKTGWKKISTGELLRAESVLKSKLGKQAKKCMDAGDLVLNKLLINLVIKKLKQKAKGFIFDGYPRNHGQLKDLLNMFKKYLKKSDKVLALLIDVSDKEVKQRLSQRRVCACGEVYHLKYNQPTSKNVCNICRKKLFIRDDDKPKIIAHRLKIYRKNNKPIFDYWRNIGKLIKINGEQSIDKIHKDLIIELRKNEILEK
ncbi:MAG: nucleoside monophosphate kinase [Patescibacteria group bacterium]